MEDYFNTLISAEKMACYLDGTLSVNENMEVEDFLSSNPDMAEIMEMIDTVDSSYILSAEDEIPIECLADDFSLPFVEENFNPEEHFHGDLYIDSIDENLSDPFEDLQIDDNDTEDSRDDDPFDGFL